MDYGLLMYSQAISFILVATGVVIFHAYVNFKNKVYEIVYDSSEEREKIQKVRLHQRHE